MSRGTGTGLGILRLPSPPDDYNQGYMARLTNTLELEKRSTYFAASIGLTNAVNQAEATAWFMA
jgi:hypothetical protein|tara:strand:+ start:1708 stop:1899 length:192 start_codon:yes stop_codon:yes gene_type:complete